MNAIKDLLVSTHRHLVDIGSDVDFMQEHEGTGDHVDNIFHDLWDALEIIKNETGCYISDWGEIIINDGQNVTIKEGFSTNPA